MVHAAVFANDGRGHYFNRYVGPLQLPLCTLLALDSSKAVTGHHSSPDISPSGENQLARQGARGG